MANRVALERVRRELDDAAVASARALIEHTRSRFGEEPRQRLAFLRAEIEVLLAARELTRARSALLEALELSRTLRFRRVEGRLLISYALEVAPHLDLGVLAKVSHLGLIHAAQLPAELAVLIPIARLDRLDARAALA